MMTIEKINELENKGFKRWTKGNLDRLYINATQLGLECDYYKTGNVRSAWFNGDHVSNSEACRMKADSIKAHYMQKFEIDIREHIRF